MEQRKTVRRQFELDAVVSCPRFGLFRGQIENVSMQGMYVRVTTVNMCLHVPILITFHPEADNPSLCCDIKGMVVHQDANGFGVQISDVDEDNLSILQKTLVSHPYSGDIENTRLLAV